MEQLANLLSTTLASGYTSGGTSISITSATGFPSTGTFSVLILDQTTKAPKLLLTCTARSGTTLTTTPESTDTNCSSGDIVIAGMLSVRSVNQIFTDFNGYGTVSSRPSAPNAIGSIYVGSDSCYDQARWNGSGWDQFIAGMLCLPPAAATFSVAAQGADGTEASFSNATDALIWKTRASSGNNLCLRVTSSYPGTPFRKRCRFRFNNAAAAFEHFGICLYDGSLARAYGIGLRQDDARIITYEWSDLTTPNADHAGFMPHPTLRGGVWELWYGDDGTTRSFYVVQDGQNPYLWLQETSTTFLTPTGV